MRSKFDIVGSFNRQKAKSIDAERTINMYEFSDAEGKRGGGLLPTSGLQLAINFNSGGVCRAGGAFVFKDSLYMVVDENVYQINSSLIPNKIGTIGTNTGYVGIEANTHQVIFVDGVKGYIWDTTTTMFTEITSPGFPAKPIDVAFLDGFFIVPGGETPTFTISNLNDGLTWLAANSASISSHPGNITALATLHRRLFIFSETFCEVWENAGLFDFPFRRNNGLLMEYGTIAKASVVSAFDRLFFLSKSREGFGHVIMVMGTQAMPVSNQSLDFEIQGYSTPQDATGMVTQDNGIIFYRLNFTVDDITWVYNATQSVMGDPRWHEEQMLGGSRHIGEVAVYFNNRNFFGAYNTDKLYAVSPDFLTNDGEEIIRERITKQLYDQKTNNRLRVDRLYIDLVQGEVPPNGRDAQPYVFLSISRDGGREYGNELKAPMGKIGERRARTVFRKLGVARTFTFRVRFYNAVKFVILGANIDTDILPE